MEQQPKISNQESYPNEWGNITTPEDDEALERKLANAKHVRVIPVEEVESDSTPEPESERELATEQQKTLEEERAKELKLLNALLAERDATREKIKQAISVTESDSSGGGEDNSDSIEADDDPDDPEIAGIIGQAEHKLDEEEIERIQTLETELAELRPELAELYARNRRLIVGPNNRAKFNEIKAKYDAKLTEYLRLKSKETYEAEDATNRQHLQEEFDQLKAQIDEQLIEFAGGDLENTDKTSEELEAERQKLLAPAAEQLKTKYDEQNKETKAKVNAEFLKEYLEQENNLWQDTNESLDKGTIFRQAVSKIITNKYLKAALAGAAVVGLAVTGVGLAAGIAAGTTAVSFGLGAGTALGAVRGGLAGAVMSRQSSESSALNDLDQDTREQNVRDQLENIDALGENDDVKNVVGWMLEQYSEANATDRSSNIKRTAIATGLGAALGALAGSAEISDNITIETTKEDITGYEPISYDVSANMSNVNVPEGGGAYNTFTQMGGDPADLDKAIEIMHSIDASYGLSPGSNGEVAGYNGLVGQYAHTYPGTIDTWPDVVQDYTRAVAEEWAKQGLIPAQQTGGEPIYGTVPDITTKIVPNFFANLLAQATTVAGIGAAAGFYADRQNYAPEIEAPEITEVPEPETPPVQPQAPIETLEPAPTSESTPEQQPIPESALVSEPTPEQQPTPEVSTPEPASEEVPSDYDFNREQIDKALGNIIGQEGVDYLASPEPGLKDGDGEKFANYWNNLPEDGHNAILNYYSTWDPDSLYGAPLRAWLQLQGEIPA